MENQDLEKQYFFKEQLKKLDQYYDNKMAYEFFIYYIEYILNKENNIHLVTGFINNLKRYMLVLTYVSQNQAFIINYDFVGILFNRSFFIHLLDLIDYKNYEIFGEKQLKNFLFYFYENKEINKILIQNQYFNNSKLKKHNIELFLNFSNILNYKDNTYSCLGHLEAKQKSETYNYNFNFLIKVNNKSFLDVPEKLIHRLRKNQNEKFFNFDHKKFNDIRMCVSCGILQNIFNFDNLYDYLTENIKKKDLNKYENLKDYKKKLRDLDQQEIIQFFNFDDLKILVEE